MSEQTSLNNAQRRFLRGLGHQLNPIVQVGQRDISENLIANVEAGLKAHELIKVKVHDGDRLDETAERLCKETGAEVVQKIGKVLLLWRRNKEEPKITLPKS
ncbi:MAG: ribosome assembly RNA-binding protein YhbY [Myxococcota bacterium]|nr:ribosome assembly RNA-binding protein YhbY [Myxococcota bacterium]